MDRTVLVSVVGLFLAFTAWGLASLKLAQMRNERLFAQSPDALPYTWGYFLGYSGIFAALIAVAAGIALMAAGWYRDWLPYAMLYAAASGFASYGVLMRRRWGWVIHIPLSLNLGLWAFNSVYLSNRWREFPWR